MAIDLTSIQRISLLQSGKEGKPTKVAAKAGRRKIEDIATKKTHKITTYITQDEAKFLAQRAAELEIPMAQYVRELLKHAIKSINKSIEKDDMQALKNKIDTTQSYIDMLSKARK